MMRLRNRRGRENYTSEIAELRTAAETRLGNLHRDNQWEHIDWDSIAEWAGLPLPTIHVKAALNGQLAREQGRR